MGAMNDAQDLRTPRRSVPFWSYLDLAMRYINRLAWNWRRQYVDRITHKFLYGIFYYTPS